MLPIPMLESKTDELTVPLEGRAEMERAKFPTDFPGSLEINPNKENIPILHQQYRKVDANNNVLQDFIWFVSVFLSRIQPLRTKFGEKCTKKLVSDIYTVSDEAYGLLVLYNYKEVWDKQQELKNEGAKGKDLRCKSKYIDSESGSKAAWGRSGINTYNELCKYVEKRRSESQRFEKKVLEYFTSKDRTSDLVITDHCDELYTDAEIYGGSIFGRN